MSQAAAQSDDGQFDRDAAMGRLLRELLEMVKGPEPQRLVAEIKGDQIDMMLARERHRKGGKLKSDERRRSE